MTVIIVEFPAAKSFLVAAQEPWKKSREARASLTPVLQHKQTTANVNYPDNDCYIGWLTTSVKLFNSTSVRVSRCSGCLCCTGCMGCGGWGAFPSVIRILGLCETGTGPRP